MRPSYEELKTFLLADGWEEFKTHPPIWPELQHAGWSKKRFEDVQLVLSFTAITIHGSETEFISVDIKMEKAGIWYNLQAYSISPKEFMEKHVEIEDKLIALRSTLCL